MHEGPLAGCAGALTKMGRKMVEFPLDPPLAKMLLTGSELGCGAEVPPPPPLTYTRTPHVSALPSNARGTRTVVVVGGPR